MIMIYSLCSCVHVMKSDFHCHLFAISTALCGIKAVNLLLQPLMVPFWPEQTSFRNKHDTKNSHFEQQPVMGHRDSGNQLAWLKIDPV